MKSILFVAEYKISGNTGGVGRVAATLAKGFLKKGYHVYYYAVDKQEEAVMDGVQQFYCKDYLNIGSVENQTHLRNLLQKLNIDIILNQSGFHAGIQDLMSRAKQPSTLLITTHHNCIKCLYDNYRRILANSFQDKVWFKWIDNRFSWFFIESLFKFRFRKTMLSVLRQSDRLVLLSKFFINDLFFFSKKIAVEKVTAIANPAPFKVSPKALEKKENRVLFIGVLKTNQKRVERLIDIWAAISKQFPDWHFDILGDGPERAFLEKSFRERGLKRYGFFGFSDPQPFLEKAKLFCMVSDFEGFGMVLVESQAYGVVPFAFNSFTSVKEIITTGKDGILIAPFNMEEYIQQLALLMSDEIKRMEMATQAQLSVQKFRLDIVIENWENLFQQIRNEKGL